MSLAVVRFALTLALALALALLAASPAAAQVEVVSPRPQTAAVVVYRDRPTATAALYRADDSAPFNPADPSGLALITETREVDLPAGRVRLRFRGVAEGMLPQSATLEGLSGGLEQNYDFDLLTPGSLIAGAIGERVRRVRTNPETGTVVEEAAVLRSGPAGVVLDIAGRIEALGCSGGPERLVFERVPPGLADTPTLSVLVDSPRAGRRTLTLSYLTFGLQWAADYVAQVRPDGRTLDLLGWITLSNRTRTTFPDAPLQVVAGKLNREDAEAPRAQTPFRSPNCWGQDTTTNILDIGEVVVTARRLAAVSRGELAPPPPPPPAEAPPQPAPAVIAEQSELGDYKLYTLPERVTVAARQTKQVAFLLQRAAPFERVYVHEVGNGDGRSYQPATVSYRLANTEAGGLGQPLPDGTVSVIAPGSDGRLALVGQARTEDLPVGSPVRLDVGRSIDVAVRAWFDAKLAAERSRFVVEAEIHNAGALPAIVEIVHPVSGRAFQVEAESQAHMVRDSRPVWSLVVPENGRRTLRYTVEVGA